MRRKKVEGEKGYFYVIVVVVVEIKKLRKWGIFLHQRIMINKIN